jgi:hypothetical protein
MKPLFLKIILVVFSLASVSVAAPAPKVLSSGFINHGVAVPVSESRGILAARDSKGAPWIVALPRDREGAGVRVSFLVINPLTGASQQYWYPSAASATTAKSSGDVFQVMRASNDRIYCTIGSRFVEFNLDSRKWTFEGDVDGMAMSLAEGPDGVIYCSSFPHSFLYSFNPKTRQLKKLGQLDPSEKYPFKLAVNGDGWIYAGIGTARANVVAFNLTTHQRVQLIDEKNRRRGDGLVYLSSDGNVYGRAVNGAKKTLPLLKLHDGKATEVAGDEMPPEAVTGSIRFTKMLAEFPGGGKITEFSLADKTATVELDGKTHHIKFDYASNGAGITGMIAGSDGKLYGSTSHPGCLFVFDPVNQKLQSLGSIPSLGGGNVPAFAVNGTELLADTYGNGGAFYIYDTAKPWNPDKTNPRMLEHIWDVQRPRVALAANNGKFIFGGFGGYGTVGGGFAVYDSTTQMLSAIPPEDLLPGHAPVALARLDAKTIVAGTSIDAVGGGHEIATDAELLLLDADTLKVLSHTIPVRGATDIFGLAMGNDGLIYGLTRQAQFFVFDPKTHKVVHQADWSKWGYPFIPGFSLWLDHKGRVHALTHNFVLAVQPDFSVREEAKLPMAATSGGMLLGNRLYFSSGSELCSVDVSMLDEE